MAQAPIHAIKVEKILLDTDIRMKSIEDNIKSSRREIDTNKFGTNGFKPVNQIGEPSDDSYAMRMKISMDENTALSERPKTELW